MSGAAALAYRPSDMLPSITFVLLNMMIGATLEVQEQLKELTELVRARKD